MRILVIIFFLIVCAEFKSFGQERTNEADKVYQYGSIRITVREEPAKLIVGQNDLIESNDSVKWENITYYEIEKLENKTQTWKASNSFTASELVELKLTIDKAMKEDK